MQIQLKPVEYFAEVYSVLCARWAGGFGINLWTRGYGGRRSINVPLTAVFGSKIKTPLGSVTTKPE